MSNDSSKCQASFTVRDGRGLQHVLDALQSAGAQVERITALVDYVLEVLPSPLNQLPDMEKQDPAPAQSDGFANRLLGRRVSRSSSIDPEIRPPYDEPAQPAPTTDRKQKKPKEKKTYTFGRKDKPALAEAIARGFDVLGFIRIPDTAKGWTYLSTKDPQSKKVAVYRVFAGAHSEGISVDLLASLEKSYPDVFNVARKAGLKLALPRAELRGGTCQIGLHTSGELGSCDAMRALHCKKHHDESHGDLLHTFVPLVAAPIR